MDYFKKFSEELPGFTQKVIMAAEAVQTGELTDEEKQMAFMRLIHLRDAADSVAQQLREDLNRGKGRVKIMPIGGPGATMFFCDSVDDVLMLLDKMFGGYPNKPEDGDKA